MLTSQAQSVDSQALAQVQVSHPGPPACKSGSVSSPVVSRSRSTTSNFGRGDLDSLYGDEIFSLELDNEAALRENQAPLEALGGFLLVR